MAFMIEPTIMAVKKALFNRRFVNLNEGACGVCDIDFIQGNWHGLRPYFSWSLIFLGAIFSGAIFSGAFFDFRPLLSALAHD